MSTEPADELSLSPDLAAVPLCPVNDCILAPGSELHAMPVFKLMIMNVAVGLSSLSPCWCSTG